MHGICHNANSERRCAVAQTSHIHTHTHNKVLKILFIRSYNLCFSNCGWLRGALLNTRIWEMAGDSYESVCKCATKSTSSEMMCRLVYQNRCQSKSTYFNVSHVRYTYLRDNNFKIHTTHTQIRHVVVSWAKTLHISIGIKRPPCHSNSFVCIHIGNIQWIPVNLHLWQIIEHIKSFQFGGGAMRERNGNMHSRCEIERYAQMLGRLALHINWWHFGMTNIVTTSFYSKSSVWEMRKNWRENKKKRIVKCCKRNAWIWYTTRTKNRTNFYRSVPLHTHTQRSVRLTQFAVCDITDMHRIATSNTITLLLLASASSCNNWKYRKIKCYCLHQSSKCIHLAWIITSISSATFICSVPSYVPM